VANSVQQAYLWVKYQQITNAKASFLQANGVTTSDQSYKDYLSSTINPAISQLETQGEASGWTAQFLKSTSLSPAGLTANTAPIRSVMTWNVLPITADLENGKSIAWRKAIINVQEAASALLSIRTGGGSKADEQTIIDGLGTQLAQIGQTNPAFAAELQRYSFTKFEDLVNLELQQDAATYGTG
jgi:hypothetical protein